MNEKPLERLNYYNGMPLNASDFKTEQEYHMRTRRWLNKSLYSAGIARGLEVREVPGSPSVVVSPGLAIDSEGREIILLEETTVEVCSYAGTDESTVVGNYLVIEYAEETIAYEQGGCAVRTTGTSASKSTTNWGGPSRIQAQVKFSWVPFVPQPGSNQIVLAQVELADGCGSVHQIDPGARRYIGAASAAMVRQYALEGERHIDSNNPGRIYFYIRGQEPNSVSLCLRSERFSTLYYTELGQHSHGLIVAGTFGGPVDATTGSPSLNTDSESGASGTDPTPHEHNDFYATYYGDDGRQQNCAIPLINLPPLTGKAGQGNLANKVSTDGSKSIWGVPHAFHPTVFQAKITGTTAHIHQHDHTHAFTQGSSSGVGSAGVSDLTARNDAPIKPEKALTFVDDLQVWIGPDIDSLVNRTEDIRRQLQSMRPSQEDWNKLGEGPTKPDHAFIKKGTGIIRLDFLPTVSFSEGEYVIDLRVASGGGRIHYNLYIE